MTINSLEELKDAYTTIMIILRAERNMRERVFASKPQLEKKLAEIDLVIENITAMKDALKAHLQPVELQQPALIVVPPSNKYQ